ncbi:MAG: hypothetical protein NT067_05670 [Candidatus Diapherotrites archaeon]|nr:hypothetical protein [Candidatus Diapherotrites archaeon]
MFKRILLALLLLSVLAGAGATIVVLKPVYKAVEPGQTETLGAMMRGERLLITIDRNASFHRWTGASITQSLLPQGWIAFPAVVENTSISLEVVVPDSAEIRSQTIEVTAVDSQTGLEEKINLVVFVEQGLVSVLLPDAQQKVKVKDSPCYHMILQNGSIASHKVFVSSSLPKYWFAGIEKEIKPNDFVEFDACINALVIGSRDFYFFVDSARSTERLRSVKASVDVLPTVQGKYSAALNGFPFYMPTLIPYYLIDSALSFFS